MTQRCDAMTADVEKLLVIARETIAKTRNCFAITMDSSGQMHARVVQPGELDADWRVAFFTSRRSRKVREIEQTGKLMLGYQYDPEGAYVTLNGRPEIFDDVGIKRSLWTQDLDRWYPGGPEDSDVVLIELCATRIELWSAAHKVWPDISAAVLKREGPNWTYETT